MPIEARNMTLEARGGKVVAKTASYTVTTDDLKFGRWFTTRGATGAITFTLMAASAAIAGAWVRFFNVADQDMIVATADEETVSFNDLTADSVAVSTTSEQIGGVIEAVCDGTSWVIWVANNGATATVASA